MRCKCCAIAGATDGGAARVQRASHEEAATAADVMPGADGVERPEMLYPAGD